LTYAANVVDYLSDPSVSVARSSIHLLKVLKQSSTYWSSDGAAIVEPDRCQFLPAERTAWIDSKRSA
jgi:hypothetical protein